MRRLARRRDRSGPEDPRDDAPDQGHVVEAVAIRSSRQPNAFDAGRTKEGESVQTNWAVAHKNVYELCILERFTNLLRRMSRRNPNVSDHRAVKVGGEHHVGRTHIECVIVFR